MIDARTLTLHTDRLVLRPHTSADFDDLTAMWADPAIAGAIGAPPSTPAESWSRLLRYRRLWEVLGHGDWCIRRRTDNAYVGDVGFADFHRPMTPPLGPTPEAGWMLAPRAQGQRLATEALRAALDWIDRQPGLDRTTCIIAPDNIASHHVAATCGYEATHTALLSGKPVSVLERRRPAPS